MRRGNRKTIVHLMAAVVAFALISAACSAASDQGGDTFDEVASGLSDGEGTTDPTEAASTADREEGPAASPEDLGTGGITPVALQSVDFGRDIIFTADLTVAVGDVAEAGERATREIQGLGGFLFGQRTTASPQPTSVLTFKVQPADFSTALDRLGSIGEVRTQNVTAQDVTEKIVDLESRIATSTASVDRLRALLAEASDVKTIVELENELLARETELETLRGSLRTLQDQVALATIVLTLTEAASHPALDVAVTGYPGHDGGLSCPGSPDLTVEEGTEATMCVEITNVGDTWLSGFELRDPVLDIEFDDMTVVLGDPTRPLEPGSSISLAYEMNPERDVRTQTKVTAKPTDETGGDVPGRPASATVGMFIGAADPGGIASFGEGLEASWDLLVALGQLIVLIVGALIPFAWVPVVIWLIWRYLVRSREPQEAPAVESS